MAAMIVVGLYSWRSPLEWKSGSGDFGFGVHGGVAWIAWRETPPRGIGLIVYSGTPSIVIMDDIHPIFPGSTWWRLPTSSPVAGLRFISIPLWMPFTLICGLLGLFYYRVRGLPEGRCKNCAYDLTGNVSGVCPECGASI
jgi:hypothetical protein